MRPSRSRQARGSSLPWDHVKKDVILRRELVMPVDADTPFSYETHTNLIPRFRAVFGSELDWGSCSFAAEHTALCVLDSFLAPLPGEHCQIRGVVFTVSLAVVELSKMFLADVIQHCPFWHAHIPGDQVREWLVEGMSSVERDAMLVLERMVRK